jgi:hypothetical protein
MKTLKQELEQLAEEDLCHECHAPLSEEEKEQGYVCFDCVHAWADEAMYAMEA